MSLQVEFVKNPFTEALFPLFGTLNKTTSTLHLNLESALRIPILLLMDKILHDLKDPKLWELWYIPYYGSCRILSINRISIL